ncbi:MAG: ABC transporter ATP-binding protein/permease [Oscillospiraceae bacterium]|nr:ABC transporter ATP-binding protein/permease [Oscillospiraceae bacterium]
MKKSKEKKNPVVRPVLKYFLPIAWKNFRGYFFCGIFKVITSAVTPFINILMLPLIIDELLGERNVEELVIFAAVIVLGNSLLNMLNSILSMTMQKYDERMQNFFSEEMSRRVMEMDFQHTEDKNALDQIEKARTGMGWYSGGVHGICTQFFDIISNTITLAGVIVLMAIYAPILFALILVILVVNTIVRAKNSRIEIESYEKLSKINRIFFYLGWELSNFKYGKDIRLYGADEMMAQKWEAYTDDSIGIWKSSADKTLPFDFIYVVTGLVRNIGAYLYLGILAITGSITIGIFSQMLSASTAFNDSLNNLMGSVQEISKRCSYAYEYIKFMEYPAAIEKGDKQVSEKPHTIEFRNVSFTYPNTDVKALDNVSITLKQGEHLSVVGLNGAGKTTFVKLLCRLYDPTDGEILLDGINIKEYDYNEYMSLFSPVFQDFRLFSFSVADNITLENECDSSELNALIEQVGLADKISSLENGTDTMLFKAFDETGVEPSGGEQQKIAIARALFKRSPVVILDEPTAALDPVAEYDIYRQFDDLVGEKTAIYISHRLSSCQFCHKIAVFAEGCIKEYGTHDQLCNIANGIYAKMFEAQAQYYR